MTKKDDNNDREMLQLMLSTLDQVSEERRERILRTLLTYYDLNLSNGPRRILSEPRPAVHTKTNDRELSFADRATISPKDFLYEKQPKTDIERVACLAYYLSHYRSTPHFKTIDISKLNTEAAQLKFSNPAHTAANAATSGLLTPAERGKKQISAVGERFVDALPNRDDAKAVLAGIRPARRRKKSSNTKKSRKAAK